MKLQYATPSTVHATIRNPQYTEIPLSSPPPYRRLPPPPLIPQPSLPRRRRSIAANHHRHRRAVVVIVLKPQPLFSSVGSVLSAPQLLRPPTTVIPQPNVISTATQPSSKIDMFIMFTKSNNMFTNEIMFIQQDLYPIVKINGDM
ncbi:hypothetical protein Droror1_Dr00001924 [Drosera rotundifolia]